MTEFKGRHFGFLLMLCSSWILARTAMNWPADVAVKPRIPVLRSLPGAAFSAATVTAVGLSKVSSSPDTFARQFPVAANGRAHRFNQPLNNLVGLLPAPASVPAGLLFSVPGKSTPGIQIQNAPSASLHADIDAYAYSFWRGGGPSGGLATAGQYGGGQSGLIATIGVSRSGRRLPLAILIRSAVSHDNVNDRELALGVRWRLRQLPLSISVERRFRSVGADNYAVYAAGGRSDLRLPAGFKLDAFGQAGFVSGQNGGHFFDAQAKAERRMLPGLPLPLHVGAGVWAGGQTGIARVDVGPSLRTELPLGRTRLRISADWRFRVAGSASPGNGPALTLSTGF